MTITAGDVHFKFGPSRTESLKAVLSQVAAVDADTQAAAEAAAAAQQSINELTNRVSDAESLSNLL